MSAIIEFSEVPVTDAMREALDGKFDFVDRTANYEPIEIRIKKISRDKIRITGELNAYGSTINLTEDADDFYSGLIVFAKRFKETYHQLKDKNGSNNERKRQCFGEQIGELLMADVKCKKKGAKDNFCKKPDLMSEKDAVEYAMKKGYSSFRFINTDLSEKICVVTFENEKDNVVALIEEFDEFDAD